MHTSVVIITKDEQPRLRLALIALNRQTVTWQQDAEVVIVDDGSARPVGAEDIPPGTLQPRILRHEKSKGRSASRNAGAAMARGRRLLFLDGDVLMSPRAIESHGRLGPDEMGRGEQRHLRSTRFFRDPRTGDPWPGKEERVRSLGRLEQHIVTEQMVGDEPFEQLLKRSDVAIYPGAAPRRLYELEMRALRSGAVPRTQWMAASGHNFSIPSELFARSGGFAMDISINEHRELALRLCREGARVVVAEDAISLHLTHREGYRDPLKGEDNWEQAFARRHPRETELMVRLWRSLAGDPSLAEHEKVNSLEEVEALLQATGS